MFATANLACLWSENSYMVLIIILKIIVVMTIVIMIIIIIIIIYFNRAFYKVPMLLK